MYAQRSCHDLKATASEIQALHDERSAFAGDTDGGHDEPAGGALQVTCLRLFPRLYKYLLALRPIPSLLGRKNCSNPNRHGSPEPWLVVYRETKKNEFMRHEC
jgi:hypothetical protein